jgi:hypothetical protein
MSGARFLKTSTFAAMIAVVLSVPAASGKLAEPHDGKAHYLPVQSISYEFGSKFMSGYFVQDAATCFITVMIIEKSDPEHVLPVTAARLRLSLNPGQVAGFDSEEGRSLNFTCGEHASMLSMKPESGRRSWRAKQPGVPIWFLVAL